MTNQLVDWPVSLVAMLDEISLVGVHAKNHGVALAVWVDNNDLVGAVNSPKNGFVSVAVFDTIGA